MIRVAVVDDEEKIRLGLAKLIEKTGSGCRVTGVFANAPELLKRLDDLEADLVITDIKMPQLDGLQLLERIRRRRPDIQLAILSGFGDFGFARQAIRGGAIDYLLKPVDVRELKQLLEKAARQAAEQRQRRSGELGDYLGFLLGGEPPRGAGHYGADLPERLERHPLFRHLYAVLLVHAGQEMSEAVAETLTSGEGREREVAWLSGGKAAVVLAIRDGDHAQTVREEGMKLLNRMPAGSRIRIGASGVFQGSQRLKTACEQASLALLQAWYAEGKRLMAEYIHQPAQEHGGAGSLFQLLDRDFRAAVEVLDVEQAMDALLAWTEEAARLKPDWPALAAGCTAATAIIRSQFPGAGEPSLSGSWEPGRFADWETFRQHFLRRSESDLEALREARQGSRVVETVKAYIRQRYAEEMELGRLAELVFLTPSYLSKLFRTETGETITDYLISVRIEKAKELLRDGSGWKTYEIGEKVGYADPAYFNKVFKKMTGLTPKEYRKRVR